MSEILNRLQVQLERHDFDGSCKSAVDFLERFPDNVLVTQCYITSLINIGQFEQALDLIEKQSESMSTLLQKAYTLYRLHKLPEALQVISGALNNSQCDTHSRQQFLELKGQVLYRAADYKESKTSYCELLESGEEVCHDLYAEERQTNLLAALTLNTLDKDSNDAGSVDKFKLDENENSYEISYNLGCLYTAQGSYEKGLKSLLKAETLFKEYASKEGMSETEIVDEIAIIRVQIAVTQQYIVFHYGKGFKKQPGNNGNRKKSISDGGLKDSLQCYATYKYFLHNDNLADPLLKYVCAHNSMLDPENMEGDGVLAADDDYNNSTKLNNLQRFSMDLNLATKAYVDEKYDECVQICMNKVKLYSDLKCVTSFHILQVKATNRIDGNNKNALALIQSIAEEAQNNQSGNRDILTLYALCEAQLLLEDEEFLDAAKVLLSRGAQVFRKTGLLGAIVSMYKHLDMTTDANELMQKCSQETSGDGQVDMLVALSDVHSQLSELEKAEEFIVRALEKQQEIDDGDKTMVLTAKYILVLIRQGKNVDQLIGELPDVVVNKDTSDKIQNLLAIPAKKRKGRQQKTRGASSNSDSTNNNGGIKKRRRKKGKLPKVLTDRLDEERWLSKSQRSEYKKSKKNRNRK